MAGPSKHWFLYNLVLAAMLYAGYVLEVPGLQGGIAVGYTVLFLILMVPLLSTRVFVDLLFKGKEPPRQYWYDWCVDTCVVLVFFNAGAWVSLVAFIGCSWCVYLTGVRMRQYREHLGDRFDAFKAEYEKIREHMRS